MKPLRRLDLIGAAAFAAAGAWGGIRRAINRLGVLVLRTAAGGHLRVLLRWLEPPTH